MAALRALTSALALALLASCASAAERSTPRAVAHSAVSPHLADLLAYVRERGGTGFIVIQDGVSLIDERWAAPQSDRMFANFAYGEAANGDLLEDVASQQKSFVAVLAAIAVDRRLLDVDAPVSRYIGAGWSKASPEQEAHIRVLDILTMTSGLDEQFRYAAAPGSVFLYNTPVYAVTKRILEAAADQPLEALTRDWLTAPLGMTQTAWRRRPGALSSVGNATGLVTTPHDIARFGLMVLHGGVAQDGARVVSKQQLDALFTRTTANPAYGRLWWLNGAAYSMRSAPASGRREGPLIASAPADLVGALGFLDRRLYVVPSRKLVVVRTGAATGDENFDQELWSRLMKVLG